MRLSRCLFVTYTGRLDKRRPGEHCSPGQEWSRWKQSGWPSQSICSWTSWCAWDSGVDPMYQVVGISQRSWGQIRQCLSHTATCNTPISVAKAVATNSCAHRLYRSRYCTVVCSNCKFKCGLASPTGKKKKKKEKDILEKLYVIYCKG